MQAIPSASAINESPDWAVAQTSFAATDGIRGDIAVSKFAPLKQRIGRWSRFQASQNRGSSVVKPKSKKVVNKCKNPLKSSDFRGFLVRVAGFEPTASWTRTMRATNCATPGYGFLTLCRLLLSVGISVVKPDFPVRTSGFGKPLLPVSQGIAGTEG